MRERKRKMLYVHSTIGESGSHTHTHIVFEKENLLPVAGTTVNYCLLIKDNKK